MCLSLSPTDFSNDKEVEEIFNSFFYVPKLGCLQLMVNGMNLIGYIFVFAL